MHFPAFAFADFDYGVTEIFACLRGKERKILLPVNPQIISCNAGKLRRNFSALVPVAGDIFFRTADVTFQTCFSRLLVTVRPMQRFHCLPGLFRQFHQIDFFP